MDENPLTEDLLIEILLWLPVVSLLRFKAVCKHWRSIMESSDFIHRHATFENSTSKLGNFIFQYRPKHIKRYDYKPCFFVLSSSRGSGDGGEEEDYGQWSYKNLGLAPHLSDDDEYDMYAKYPPQANMVGSCHGIICIHDPHLRDVILWNPATNKYRCLPKSLPLLDEFGALQTEFVLFGFDCETYDYKVIKIAFFTIIKSTVDVTPPNKIQIYSLRSDSWRWCTDSNLHAHSYQGNSENQGRYLNGSYYFLGKTFHTNETRLAFWRYPVLLSFNFSRESFRMIPLQDYISRIDIVGEGDEGKIVHIRLISENTANNDVIRKSSTYINEVYEVCALNDYDYSCSGTNADNDEYSWSKLHTFTVNHLSGRLGPKAITKDGKLGFLCGYDGGLVFINFLTGEMKDIEIVDASVEGLGDVLRADVYKESLVSIDSAFPSSSSYLK